MKEIIRKKQSFSRYVDEYIYNERTKLLEKLDTQIDIQEKINSANVGTLQDILDKFTLDSNDIINNNGVLVNSNVIGDYSRKRADLSELGELIEIAQDYREQYNLPIDMPIEKVYQFVQDDCTKILKDFKNRYNNGGVKDEEKSKIEPKSE